jgi:hypothetical protein
LSPMSYEPMVRRALARALRRWADLILPGEDKTPKLIAGDASDSDVSDPFDAKQPASGATATRHDHLPHPSGSAPRAPGHPPQHWLELVRNAAPDLLQPAARRAIAHASGTISPQGSITPPEGRQLGTTAEAESALAATAQSSFPMIRSASGPVTESAPGQTSRAPDTHVQMTRGSMPKKRRSGLRRARLSAPPSALSKLMDALRHALSRTSKPSPLERAAPVFQEPVERAATQTHRTQSEPSVSGIAWSTLHPPESQAHKASRVQLLEGASDSTESAADGSTKGQNRSSQAKRHISLQRRGEEAVRSYHDAGSSRPTLVPELNSQSFDPLIGNLNSTTAKTSPPSAISSGQVRALESAGIGELPLATNVRVDSSPSHLPDTACNPWPELPGDPVHVLSKGTAPDSTSQLDGNHPQVFTHWPHAGEGRWPELLREPDSSFTEGADAFEVREHLTRLDLEQRGGR